MAFKYLDENGLLYFWQKIVSKFVAKEEGKGLSANDYTTAEKEKLAGLENPNVQTVKVNGTALTPDASKAVNVDLSDYALKSDVVGGVTVKGSVAKYADLPTEGQKTGDMYNVQAADKSHGIKAGDNVVWDGTEWDNFGGLIDLSDYSTSAEIADAYVAKETGKGLSANDFTDALKTKLDGIAEGATKTVVDASLSETSENPLQNKAVFAALSLKAPLSSPDFTGSPTAPTAAAGTSTTQIATTAFVGTAITNAFADIAAISNTEIDTIVAS